MDPAGVDQDSTLKKNLDPDPTFKNKLAPDLHPEIVITKDVQKCQQTFFIKIPFYKLYY